MNFIMQHRIVLTCLTILMIYLMPNWLFLESAQYLIHDNLDSNVVWYKNLAESGSMFSYADDAIIPQTLGGLPRIYAPSELNILHLFYFFFTPLVAYNINILLLHFIAFIGMYLLIRDSKITSSVSSEYITLGVALCFSLLPFWPSGGITIAGQPLLIWAILNVYFKRNSVVSWSVVVLFPFYSSFILGNLFFFLTMGIVFLVHSVVTRRLNRRVIIVFVTFLTLTVLVDQRLIQIFLEGVPVHRDTWLTGESSLNFNGLIGVSIQMLFKGHYHFFGRIFPIIPIISFIGFIVAPKRLKKYMLTFFSLALLFSVIRVSRDYSLVVEYFPFFQKFNPRFHSMLPILWFLIFTLAVYSLTEYKKWGRYLSFVGFLSFVGASFFNLFSSDYAGSKYLENSFYYTFIDQKSENATSFTEFYKSDEFSLLETYLGRHDSYIICVGIAPEIAQFNGYKTLGGYYAIWPLSYCTEINELKNKNGEGCSSRFYFSSEDIENEAFSTSKMKEFNCTLILSKVEIRNPKINITRLNVENGNESFFIYQVDNSDESSTLPMANFAPSFVRNL